MYVYDTESHWNKMFFMKECVNTNQYFSSTFPTNTKSSYTSIIKKHGLKWKKFRQRTLFGSAY